MRGDLFGEFFLYHRFVIGVDAEVRQVYLEGSLCFCLYQMRGFQVGIVLWVA